MNRNKREADILPVELAQDLEAMHKAWRLVPEDQIPLGLTARTLARLEREGLRAPRHPERHSARWSALAGVAAALVLVGLGSTLEPGGGLASPHGTAWSVDLVLEEEFDSTPQEVAVRLERVRELLAEDLPRDLEVAQDPAESLRRQMDKLSQEMEAF